MTTGPLPDDAGRASGGRRPGVRVRPMMATDVDAALAMFGAVAAEDLWIAAEPDFDVEQRRERWSAGLDDPAQRSFVAVTDDDRVVGNAGLTVAPYGVAGVAMAVADGWRGRGIGGELLDALLAAARELGAHKVDLQVWPHNRRAIALYKSRGFVEEGRLRRHYRRRNGELWDAVLMGLVLDTSAPGSPHDDAMSAPPPAPGLP
jgi:RimJ/RimL family protein N-acetyltransferase